MPIRFDQFSSAPARALQIYLVLIGCAANQQTITYTKLAERLGLLTATWLFPPLSHLAEWCLHEGLAPLTSLAIAEDTGMPGPGHPLRGSHCGPAEPRTKIRLVRGSTAGPSRSGRNRSAGCRIVSSDTQRLRHFCKYIRFLQSFQPPSFAGAFSMGVPVRTAKGARASAAHVRGGDRHLVVWTSFAKLTGTSFHYMPKTIHAAATAVSVNNLKTSVTSAN